MQKLPFSINLATASVACFLQTNIAGGRMHLQPRPTAIELPFSRQRLRSPISALTVDMNVGEIRSDAMSVAHIDTGADVNGDIGSNVHGNVAGTCLKIRVTALAAIIHQLYRDSAGACFGSCRGYSIELDSATTRLSMDVSFGRR